MRKRRNNRFGQVVLTAILFGFLLCFAVFLMLDEILPVKVENLNGPFVKVETMFHCEKVVFLPQEWYEYTVQYGDSWWDLAVEIKQGCEYDTRNFVIELMEYNNRDTSNLYEGEIILLPQ